MMKPKKPDNEKQRLEALRELEILDTPAEASFDDLTLLASGICGMPVALISLIDEDRQWFKSRVGIDASETPRDLAFCAHAVHDRKTLYVPDATLDERFHDNPLVTGHEHIRFYCGAPLIDEKGYGLGTLCVIDRQPRSLTEQQIDALETVGRQVIAQLSLRRELRRSQELLKQVTETDELLRSLFDTSSFMMGMVEIRGQDIVHLTDNPATAKFIGSVDNRLSGKSASELGVPQISAEIWIHNYREAERTGQPVQFIYRRETSEGIRSVQATATHLHQHAGPYSRYSYVAEDITERLERERLIQEQGRQLIHSSKMAALGEMAAGVAHEINNPLAIIAGHSQMMRALLEKGQPSLEVFGKSLDRVETTSFRISKIVKGLLSFARAEDAAPWEVVQVRTVIEDTLALCSERFLRRHIECKIDVPQDLAFKCQAVQLSQVLLNMLNNACDAIENLNEKWIKIAAHEVDGFIELSITDSGPGIPQVVADRLFQPFFTTKEVGKGTGLGLSIAFGIVEAHHGQLRINRECANTCFEILLPSATLKAA